MNYSLLIPILSGIITIITSLLLTTLKNKSELKKIHAELQQKYSKSLFDKRIETYPLLYDLLSGYSKKMQYGKNNTENLIELRDKIDDWNNKYSIFFSINTTRISYRFRNYLKVLLSTSRESKITDNDWEAIRKINSAFQRSLRADIGILHTQPVGEIENLDEIYQFIDEKYKVDITK